MKKTIYLIFFILLALHINFAGSVVQDSKIGMISSVHGTEELPDSSFTSGKLEKFSVTRDQEISEALKQDYELKSSKEKRKKLGISIFRFTSPFVKENTKIIYDKSLGKPRRVTFTKGEDISPGVIEELFEILATDQIPSEEDQVKEDVLNFIGKYDSELGIDESQLGKEKIDEIGNAMVVSFEQDYIDVPVYGGYVKSLVHDRELVLLSSNYYPDIEVDASPKITKEGSMMLALGQGYRALVKEPELVVYPKISKDGVNYYLAYKLDFGTKKDTSGELIAPTIFIDAHTGATIDTLNRIRYETVSGHVSGMIYPDYLEQEKVRKDFFDEDIFSGSSSTTTDVDGTFNFDASGVIETKLEGPYVKLINLGQAEASFQSPVSENIEIDWEQHDGSYLQEESNVFFHTNFIRDFFANGEEPFNLNEELGFQMEANVEVPGSCNAYATGLSINFFAPNDDCETLSLYSDVIYHEYTHNVIFAVAPLLSEVYWGHTGNMNEGYADYYACSLNNDPCMTNNLRWRGGAIGCLRNCENEKKYPKDYNDEPHSGAEIISGSLWDIRQELGREYADEMALLAVSQDPQTFQELLENFLILDDSIYGNGDLTDGSPNIVTICDSFFSNHGIFSSYCLGHTTKPIAEISSPRMLDTVNGTTDIIGTVYPSQIGGEFSYSLYHQPMMLVFNLSETGFTISIVETGEQELLYSAETPAVDDILYNLDTLGISEKEFAEIDLETSVVTSEAHGLVLNVSDDGGGSTVLTYIYTNNLDILAPLEGEILRAGDNIEIRATPNFADADHFDVYYTLLNDPVERRGGIVLENDGQYAGEELIGHWDLPPEEGEYALFVEVYQDDGEKIVDRISSIYLDPTLKEGWPVRIIPTLLELGGAFGVIPSDLEPSVVDIDNDGYKEVIVYVSDNPSPKLIVYSHDGSILWSQDITIGEEILTGLGIPSIKDIDNDGYEEIIVYASREGNDGLAIFTFEHTGEIKWQTTLNFPVGRECWKSCEGIDNPTMTDAAIQHIGSTIFDLDKDNENEIILNVVVMSWYKPSSHSWYRNLDYTVILDNNGDVESKIDGGVVLLVNEKSLLAYAIGSSPTIGNFDTDNEFEIAVSSLDTGLSDSEILQLINDYEANPTEEAFIDLYHYIVNTNVLRLSAFNNDGSLAWSREMPQGIVSSSQIVGDINQDGKEEIILRAFSPARGEEGDSTVPHPTIPGNNSFGLYVIDNNGEILNEWLYGRMVDSSPSLADVNNDNIPEIILGSVEVASLDDYPSINFSSLISVVDSNGSFLMSQLRDSGYEVKYSPTTISSHGNRRSFVIGDVNNDDSLDIMTIGYYTANNMRTIYNNLIALNSFGNMIDGFPKRIASLYEMRQGASIAISDIDNDGKTEIIASSDIHNDKGGRLYVWETNSVFDEANQGWEAYLHDLQRTGCYDCYQNLSVSEPECIDIDDCDIGMICRNGVCIEQTCFDSDGGMNIFRKGSTWVDIDDVWTDTCVDSSSNLKEGYCDLDFPGEVLTAVENCPDGCKDGECISKDIFNGEVTREGDKAHFLVEEGEAIKTSNQKYILDIREVAEGRVMIDVYSRNGAGDYEFLAPLIALEGVISTSGVADVAVVTSPIDASNKKIGSIGVSGNKKFVGSGDYKGDGIYLNFEKDQSIKSTSGTYIFELVGFEGTTMAWIKVYHKSGEEYRFSTYLFAGEGVVSSTESLSAIASGIDAANNKISLLEISEKKKFLGGTTHSGNGPHLNVKKGNSIKSDSEAYIFEIVDYKTTDSGTNFVLVRIYAKSFGEYKFRGFILAGEGVPSSREFLTVTAIGIDPTNNNIDSVEISE